jgi:hypothetical protein
MSAPLGDPAVGTSSGADALSGGDGGTDRSADPELTFAMFAGASAAPLALPSLVGPTAASHAGDLQREVDAVFSGGQTYDHLSADPYFDANAAAIGGHSSALPRSLRPSSRQASAAEIEIDLLLMQSRHALPAGKHASRSRGSSRQSEVCVCARAR